MVKGPDSLVCKDFDYLTLFGMEIYISWFLIAYTLRTFGNLQETI